MEKLMFWNFHKNQSSIDLSDDDNLALIKYQYEPLGVDSGVARGVGGGTFLGAPISI